MSLFCTTCHTLLTVVTSTDMFYFKCIKCQKNYEPNDTDTLHYVEESKTNFASYKQILKNASRDPANPKVLLDCTKCDSKYVKQVRLGESKKLINCCIKCNNQWIEGS
jgi:DNA-directed RNA polymerase subunit M/transcription elongation factor TFIIS